jgi:glycine cleavage system H protein
MNIPKNLKYTKDHEWIKVNGEEAIVGITDYAQGELGDIVFVEVETIGGKVDQGGIFGTIEAVKTVSDLFMPVTGVVKELNSALEDSPDLINSDPFGEGWIIKLEVEDISEMENLLDAAQYGELLNA